MKKTSKVLALLLSVCVVFAMVAVFAFAAEPVSQLDASQYGEGIQSVTFKQGGEVFDTSNGFDSGYTGGNATSNFTKKSVTTKDGNTYMKLTKNPSYLTYEDMMTNVSKPHIQKSSNEYEYVNGYCGTGAWSAVELKNFDYIVWSLDFMTDAVKENGKLNYLDESWFGTYGDAYRYNYIVKDTEGDWYLSGNSEYSADDAPLATEPGAWNNLTVVASRVNGMVYCFANGRHFASHTAPAAFKIDRIVYNIWNSYDIYNPDWSISVDNVSLNTYATGYVSTVDFGLDDYFENLDLSVYISECDDIVYNSNYTLPSAANTEKYTVVKNGVTNVISDHYQFAKSISSLKEGDEVTSYVKLDTLLDAANIAYVKAEGDYSFRYLITGAVGAADENIEEGALVHRSSGGTTSCFNYYYEGVNTNFVPATAFAKNFFGISSGTAYEGTVSNSNFNFYLGPKGGSGTASYPTSANYKYVTMDFNLAAAGYVYLPDGATDGIYRFIGNIDGLSDTEKATAKLSYWEGARMTILSSGWDFAWYFVSKDGQWYLSADNNTYSEDDVPLASNVGEWNHVTFMHDVASGKLLVYLNGKYAVTGKLKAAEFERFSFLHLEGVSYSEYDIRYSDVSLKYYKKAYSSGVDVFGVDDFFALDDPAKYDASFVKDVSNGENSKNYGVPASVKLVRGEDTLYFKNVAQALLAAKNGDTLYYDGELILFRPINDKIENLNLVAASVTLTSDVTVLHEYKDGVLSRKNAFNAIWYDENGEEIRTDLVAIDAIPDFATLSFSTSLKGEYNQVNAWKWAREGSEDYAALSTIAGIGVGETVVIVPDVVIVAWFDTYGELIENEEWFVGSVASHDFSELEELEVMDNGWFELSYFWNSRNEDMTLVSGEDVAYLAIVEPVDAFTGLKYNFTLGTNFYINHYVPVPEDGIGVTVTGAKYAETCDSAKLSVNKPYFDDLEECTTKINALALDPMTVNISGNDYYKFDNGKNISTYAWYGLQGFEVCYTVEYEGETYELSSKVALTRLGTKESDKNYHSSYIYSILNNYGCGTDECALAVNLARYMSQAYAAQATLITFNDVDKILKNHTSCDCVKSLESYLPTEAPATDASGIAAAGEGFGASFRTNYSISTLVIYVPVEIADANPDLKITADIKGAIVNGATTLKTVTLDFFAMQSDSEPVYATNGTTKCYVYVPEYKENAAYNADLVYNITLAFGGNEYKGTYSLQTYLYNRNQAVKLYVYNSETGAYEQDASITKLTLDHRIVQLLLAQRAYAEAARNYKLN